MYVICSTYVSYTDLQKIVLGPLAKPNRVSAIIYQKTFFCFVFFFASFGYFHMLYFNELLLDILSEWLKPRVNPVWQYDVIYIEFLCAHHSVYKNMMHEYFLLSGMTAAFPDKCWGARVWSVLFATWFNVILTSNNDFCSKFECKLCEFISLSPDSVED